MMKRLFSKVKWKKSKMDVHRVLDNWTLTHPSFEKHILPYEIFKKFLTTEDMERICLESNKYVCSIQKQPLVHDDHKKVKIIYCHPCAERL